MYYFSISSLCSFYLCIITQIWWNFFAFVFEIFHARQEIEYLFGIGRKCKTRYSRHHLQCFRLVAISWTMDNGREGLGLNKGRVPASPKNCALTYNTPATLSSYFPLWSTWCTLFLGLEKNSQFKRPPCILWCSQAQATVVHGGGTQTCRLAQHPQGNPFCRYSWSKPSFDGECWLGCCDQIKRNRLLFGRQ